MKLKDSQIEIIEKELREKGIWFNPLHEDLVDHICTEVEELMGKGHSFQDSYQEVLKRFPSDRLSALNKETTHILAFSTMFKNIILTTYRHLQKQFSVSLIKMSGLAIGIAAFILSLLYVQHEYSYDNFHEDANNIFRLGRISDAGKVATTTFQLAPTLRNDFSNIEFTRFFKDRSKTLFRKDDKAFFESNMIFADEYFLTLFKFSSLTGDRATALQDPYSVVLTTQTAIKYFGRKPDLGEFIDFKWGETFYPLKITGLIEKWPDNMHINFDILVSFKTGENIFPDGITGSWKMNYCYTYARLPSNITPIQFENQFEAVIRKHVNLEEESHQNYLGFAQPVKDIHTHPEVLSNYTNVVNPIYLQMALVIGSVILIITSINFVTLNVVQFQARAKEVGVRKSVGATRAHLVFQFILETLITISISSILGLGIIYLLLNEFNGFLNVELQFMNLFESWVVIVIPFVLLLLTVFTGLYPSLYFSAQSPIWNIDSKKKLGTINLRKILLTTQFLIAAILTTFTFVILNQLNFINSKSLGYKTKQVVYIPQGRKLRENPETFMSLALNNPAVESISLSFNKPSDDMTYLIDVTAPGGEKEKINVGSVDENFFDTYGIEFISGENFNSRKMDLTHSFILNEAAVKFLELSDPVGATLKTEFQTGQPSTPFEQREGKIVGVIKDINLESLHNKIKPMIFLVKPYWYYYINIRLGENFNEGISHLASVWKQLYPELPFEYNFLDSDFAALYRKENNLAKGLIAMAVLAILTTCLGLYGYVKYVTQQRIKEVGIRKVLGASFVQTMSLLSKDFVLTLLIANVISWPIAYFISQGWLNNFAFHASITLVPFVISLSLMIALSAVTVYQQIDSMAKVDLSEVLRYN